MGAHLVKLLADRGDQVTVTTRKQRSNSAGVSYICGDAKQDDFILTLLDQKWDAIVDFMVYTTSVFERRAPLLLNATGQYVFLSSARVYANSDASLQEHSPRLLEHSNDAEFLATDEYSLAKARQENVLRDSGLSNWTIVRPYITYSEQRLQLGVLEKEAWLYRALKGRTIVFSKDIAAKLTTLTYGLDVAAAMVSLIAQPGALGQSFHITQKETVRWQDVLKLYIAVLERHLGEKPKVLMLDLEDFSKCKNAKYQINYDRLFDRRFNNSKIEAVVKVHEFTPFHEGLTRCLEEFLVKPSFLSIDWRAEAIKDRYAGEVAKFHELESWKQRLKYFFYRFIRN